MNHKINYRIINQLHCQQFVSKLFCLSHHSNKTKTFLQQVLHYMLIFPLPTGSIAQNSHPDKQVMKNLCFVLQFFAVLPITSEVGIPGYRSVVPGQETRSGSGPHWMRPAGVHRFCTNKWHLIWQMNFSICSPFSECDFINENQSSFCFLFSWRFVSLQASLRTREWIHYEAVLHEIMHLTFQNCAGKGLWRQWSQMVLQYQSRSAGTLHFRLWQDASMCWHCLQKRFVFTGVKEMCCCKKYEPWCVGLLCFTSFKNNRSIKLGQFTMYKLGFVVL